MTIRQRTERSASRSTRRAGALAAAGLLGAGVLHVLWASGSTWPAADADDLAELVVGKRRADRTTATGGD